MTLREEVAARLAYFDECGPGPVSRGEYLEDADEILVLMNAARIRTIADALVAEYGVRPELGAVFAGAAAIAETGIEAIEDFLAVIAQYPPEVLGDDGAWRIGGAAKDAWREAIVALRTATALGEKQSG